MTPAAAAAARLVTAARCLPSAAQIIPLARGARLRCRHWQRPARSPSLWAHRASRASATLRPYGGLTTTQEVKESRYFLLMLALAAYGYNLVGVPAPSPPHQPSRTPPDAPPSRRICYPYWLPDHAGRRVDIPKIHTIILGVLGSIPDSAVRSAEAAGATSDSTLWHDLTVLLVAGLHDPWYTSTSLIFF